MARYPLNLPVTLKQEAESLAKEQGVSLNQFIQWAVAEKVGALKKSMDDPRFPLITYRRGGSGTMQPMLRGTNIRVKTMVVAHQVWGLPPEEIADRWPVKEEAVREALAYYEAHPEEIDSSIAEDQALTAKYANEAIPAS